MDLHCRTIFLERPIFFIRCVISGLQDETGTLAVRSTARTHVRWLFRDRNSRVGYHDTTVPVALSGRGKTLPRRAAP